ncbi:acyl-CoA dehydrogenase family protein [Desulfovermiculus halophilus]|uniref:acyl-CoA dehydrogenase family protein n=1 Tax=Desulfovermiculus halophilus TaxID=339722 RepID=UPI00048403F0|nr:acyl-CoA dehydrogenase family protein [Desulfovermiculus halophilus]
MSNFYLDNPDILHHLQHMDLEQVIRLKEQDFAQHGVYAHAPQDLPDALDNYHRVLEIVGQIAGDFVAPRADAVDREGARFEDGAVHYAQGTKEALERLAQADLMGFTLPREYGGINMPKTVYSMAIEMISRADASLMNLFGLQEIADTICKFGSREQKERYLPRFCSGETSGAMALTEPDAGSDLQSISLRADQNEDGGWVLNGVKRFITNGCADVSLVMARSEPGISGGRGVSLFIYERDEHMRIRRIEDKLGIHGSPTCELQFQDAPAELLGERKKGLVKYTMSLMNGARLGVAAQAVGVAEAALREAKGYARQRVQFGQSIDRFLPVTEMLAEMQVSIQAGRSLLYETSRLVDIKEGLEELAERDPEQAKSRKDALKRYTRYSALFTPLVKAYTSEVVNDICDMAIQIHGGTGYTKDFPVERLYRDARITNIYEGTTQLQVVAAIGGIMTGTFFDWLDVLEQDTDLSSLPAQLEGARECRKACEAAVAQIKERADSRFQEFHARRLVDMAAETGMAYLLVRDALHLDHKRDAAELFVSRAVRRVHSRREAICAQNQVWFDKAQTLLG